MLPVHIQGSCSLLCAPVTAEPLRTVLQYLRASSALSIVRMSVTWLWKDPILFDCTGALRGSVTTRQVTSLRPRYALDELSRAPTLCLDDTVFMFAGPVFTRI